MNEALCSILCSEDVWTYDDGMWIRFKKDGTGELVCSCNFNYWICADFEWKSIQRLDRVGPPELVVESTGKRSPHLLGQLDLEITLFNRLTKDAQNGPLRGSTGVNGYSLTDDAFRPKLYTVKIEKGNFQEPIYISSKWRYALRLTFDKSPYPPQCEWDLSKGGVKDGKFWEHKEFVARHDSELDNKRKAMNDNTVRWMDSCVVS